MQKSHAVNPDGLLGGIWSPTEMTVDPREILARLPAFLADKYGVRFRFGTAVRSIQLPAIEAGAESMARNQSSAAATISKPFSRSCSRRARSIDASCR